MKKVAIVGVERSGKTVFLTAMADKYEKPDRNGVFLTSVNEATYKYYAKARAMLRDGEWPLATQPGEIVELDWKRTISPARSSVAPVFLNEAPPLLAGHQGRRTLHLRGVTKPLDLATT